MVITSEDSNKVAPGPLALIQAFVNTQYGQKRWAHAELTTLNDLRIWLIVHDLLTDCVPITEGDFRRALQLREAFRNLLHANNNTEISALQIEMFNHLASNAPLTVHLRCGGLPTLEPDLAGMDGVFARLIGIVFTAMINETWGRLKACHNEQCQKAFYDTSKNRSGIWCSMIDCGNRLKARAYRNRHDVTSDR
jgi:predicted RNA-binding Zn ribbon-like protein